MVGCGIDMDKAKLKPGGSLEPQQTISVYFTKNGKRVRYAVKEVRLSRMCAHYVYLCVCVCVVIGACV